MGWLLRAGDVWTLDGELGGDVAEVRPCADGRRWFAKVNGAALEPSGRPGTLLTWETSDGARAHVGRVLRARHGGPSALRAFFREQHARIPDELVDVGQHAQHTSRRALELDDEE